MKNIFISFSGGLTSAFMTNFILSNDKYKHSRKLIVFANTGKEKEETLNFVNQCSIYWGVKIHWIEYAPQEIHGFKNWFKIVNFETASRNGEPFEKFIIKEGIPNVNNKGCSSRLKQLPLHNFVKVYFEGQGYHTAIGIRSDEAHRINWSSANKNKYFYPLTVDFPVTKEFIHSFWENQSFTLNIKSYEGNCDCCWKKSNRKLYTIAKENPKSFEWWAEMEEKHGKGEVFYRNYLGANKLLENSLNFPKSKFAKCDTFTSKEKKQQLSFFDLDGEMPCSCQ